MDKLFLLLKEGLNKGILFFLTLYDTGFFGLDPFLWHSSIAGLCFLLQAITNFHL